MEKVVPQGIRKEDREIGDYGAVIIEHNLFKRLYVK